MVQHFANELRAVVPVDLMITYDVETATAQAHLEAQLSAAGAEQVRALVARGISVRGTPDAALNLSQHRRRESALVGDGIVLPAGAEDAEWQPDNLQASLCALVDVEKSGQLLVRLDTPPTADRRRHLLELRDPSVSRDWLWRISPIHGPVVPSEEFQDVVRLRLGAPCASTDAVCARCGA